MRNPDVLRNRTRIIAAGAVAGALTLGLDVSAVSAQSVPIPPTVARDSNWLTVSDVTLAIGVASVALTPRVYYSSPDATVGWKGRWHLSSLAPAMTLAGLTLLVDGPIKEAVGGPRVGCNTDQTQFALPDSGCESFGSPSTHAYASWGATGAGLGIFLVDTLKYSDGRFNAPAFLGQVAIPLTASFVTSAARSVNGSGLGPERTKQVAIGAVTGLGTGLLLGLSYALLQEPDCAYGGSLVCW
jgi:hypothetical protein